MNSEWSADVRFGAHSGLKPDIAQGAAPAVNQRRSRADASVRKLNSNLEGKYRRRGNTDRQPEIAHARIGVRRQTSVTAAGSKPIVSAAFVRAAPLVFEATWAPDAAAGGTERGDLCSA